MPDKMSGISLKCEGDSIMRTQCPEFKALYDVDDNAAVSEVRGQIYCDRYIC